MTIAQQIKAKREEVYELIRAIQYAGSHEVISTRRRIDELTAEIVELENKQGKRK